MSADPQRFARLVLKAFHDAGRTTDAEVKAAGGPSTTTMTKLRAASQGRSGLAEPRSQSWRGIENAANWPHGAARAVWEGADPPAPTSQVEPDETADDLVEFTVEGNFGVRAVVKGPVRDMDALQAAVSKLIGDMQVEESNVRTMP